MSNVLSQTTLDGAYPASSFEDIETLGDVEHFIKTMKPRYADLLSIYRFFLGLDRSEEECSANSVGDNQQTEPELRQEMGQEDLHTLAKFGTTRFALRLSVVDPQRHFGFGFLHVCRERVRRSFDPISRKGHSSAGHGKPHTSFFPIYMSTLLSRKRFDGSSMSLDATTHPQVGGRPPEIKMERNSGTVI